METKDHAALALFLMKQSVTPMSLLHKTAFFIGSVEPDFNPFTYMRGSTQHHLMRGHNAECTKSHILKCINRIQNQEPNSQYGFFALGTLIHYIADAFTFPHNEVFSGTMKDHVRYERLLHPIFTKTLSDFRSHSIHEKRDELFYSFSESHNAYLGEAKSMERDCGYIISVCSNMFQYATRHVETHYQYITQ